MEKVNPYRRGWNFYIKLQIKQTSEEEILLEKGTLYLMIKRIDHKSIIIKKAKSPNHRNDGKEA